MKTLFFKRIKKFYINKKLKCLLLLFLIYIKFFDIKSFIDKWSNIDINKIVKKVSRIPILVFHALIPDDVKRSKFLKYEWIGSIEVFNQIMEWLYVNNYKTINTEDFYYWYKGKTEYDHKTVLITFDDGHYDVYYLVYPILKKYNFKATCFIIGSRIKKKTPKYNKNKFGYIGEDVIDKIRKEYPNLEFQSHSYNMHYITKKCNPLIKCMNDTELGIDILENSKYGFTTFAYPYGQFNIRIQMVLKKKGYLCAFRFGPSNYATRNSVQYAIPRIKINGFVKKNYAIKWIQNANLN